MSAAEREAEQRYVMGPGAGHSYPREAVVTMKRGAFVAGVEWQAERDAEWITDLAAEVEQWRRVAAEQTRLERDRAERAEAKLAAVRAEVESWNSISLDPAADEILAVLDGDDET